jgi:Tfp pilus assembly protein PilW
MLHTFHLRGNQRPAHCKHRAFTLVEMMFSTAIGMFVIAAFAVYIKAEAPFVSSITQQSAMNSQAANALELIQSRVRVATFISTNATSTILLMGFDDNPNVDSNNDGDPYDDQDHYEWFQVQTANGTNSLVYITTNAAGSTNTQVMVPCGVCTLPNSNYFSVINKAFVFINFGVVDLNPNDYYQSVDIQGRAVSLNRMVTANNITILP